MAARWIFRDPFSLIRAMRLRWQTRKGFTVSEAPAFDPETDGWFRQRLKTLSGYIEYGSGSSTILAARQGIRTLSMESDPRYANAVRAALPDEAAVTIFDAGIGLTEYWGYPVATRPTDSRYASWLNYVKQPLEEAERRGWVPELVLVDGRFRCACALAAAQFIRRTGASSEILFDDYAGRPNYSWIEAYLGEPEMVGRAAIFAVGSLAAPKEILGATIAEAARDFR